MSSPESATSNWPTFYVFGMETKHGASAGCRLNKVFHQRATKRRKEKAADILKVRPAGRRKIEARIWPSSRAQSFLVVQLAPQQWPVFFCLTYHNHHRHLITSIRVIELLLLRTSGNGARPVPLVALYRPVRPAARTHSISHFAHAALSCSIPPRREKKKEISGRS